MSEWRGVFNHDDHMGNFIRRASCGRCGEWCYPHDPCSCCEKQALGDQTAAEVLAECDALRESVQRVRSIAQRHLEAEASGKWVAQEILAAVDGAQ